MLSNKRGARGAAIPPELVFRFLCRALANPPLHRGNTHCLHAWRPLSGRVVLNMATLASCVLRSVIQ